MLNGIACQYALCEHERQCLENPNVPQLLVEIICKQWLSNTQIFLKVSQSKHSIVANNIALCLPWQVDVATMGCLFAEQFLHTRAHTHIEMLWRTRHKEWWNQVWQE